MSRTDPRNRAHWQARTGFGSTSAGGASDAGAASNSKGGSSITSDSGAGTSGPVAGGLHRIVPPERWKESDLSQKQPISGEHDGRQRGPRPYSLDPPGYRPHLHPYAAGLSTPDFYPATQDQPELTFDTQITRDGLQTRSQTQIASEAFSVHNMIYERLSTPGVLSTLSALLHNVVHLRLPSQGFQSSVASGVDSHSFRLPSRVTLNDLKLGNYIRQLADPSVPLQRLARSVPHGSKGERLLEMLWLGAPPPTQQSNAYSSIGAHGLRISASTAANNGNALGSGPPPHGVASVTIPTSVPIERAVWFIRVIGASDIQSARNRTTNYTAEWTSTVVAWLGKQLQEVSLAVEVNKSAPLATPALGTGAHATSPLAGGAPGALSSPITAGIVSPSSGPSSPVQNRSFGATSTFGRSAFWQGNSALTGADLAQQSPSGPHGGRQNRVLLHPALLPRWISRWTYALSLVRALLYQGLLSERTLFTWIADALNGADVAQTSVLICLIEESLEDMAIPTSLPRSGVTMPHTWWGPLASSLCDRLQDFLPHAAPTAGPNDLVSALRRLDQNGPDAGVNIFDFASRRIRVFLLHAFDIQPYLFLHPTLLKDHKGLLEKLLLAEANEVSSCPSVRRLSKFPAEQRKRDLAELSTRGDRMIDGLYLAGVRAGVRSATDHTRYLVEVLQAYQQSPLTHDKLFERFFTSQMPPGQKGPSHDSESDALYVPVKVLLTWASRSDKEHAEQGGAPQGRNAAKFSEVDADRPFVAAQLLLRLAGVQEPSVGRTEPRSVASSNAADVHIMTMRWLSEVDEFLKRENLEAAPDLVSRPALADTPYFVEFDRVLTILGELERLGLFSFSKYMQRLTARGLIQREPLPGQDIAQAVNKSNVSKAADSSFFGRLLRSVPIESATEAQLRARRSAIYGSRSSESHEEAMERRALRELRRELDWMLENNSTGDESNFDTVRPSGTSAKLLSGEVRSPHRETADSNANTNEEHEQEGFDGDKMEELFSDDADGESEYDVDIADQSQQGVETLPTRASLYFFRCSRFTQCRLIRDVIIPKLPSCKILLAAQLSAITTILLAASKYVPLAQLITTTITSSTPLAVLQLACDTLASNTNVWRATGTLQRLLSALQTAYDALIAPSIDALLGLSQMQSPTSDATTERLARIFCINKCAWTCVRLGAMDFKHYLQGFASRTSTLRALQGHASGIFDLRQYFDGLMAQSGDGDIAWRASGASLTRTVGDQEATIDHILIGMLRVVRTASITTVTDIGTRLLRFCEAQACTLDQAVAKHGSQLWANDVVDDLDWPALGQGRVSFRAHRKFLLDLIVNGCASAETTIKTLLLPPLVDFASGCNISDDIVGRTAVACAVSILRDVLLTSSAKGLPSSPLQRSEMGLYSEKLLLLRKECIPLLAQLYVTLVLAGRRLGRNQHSNTSKISQACAALSTALLQDGAFRAAIAKNHPDFIRSCRLSLDGIGSSDQVTVMISVADLVAPANFSTCEGTSDDGGTVLRAIDCLTATRAFAGLALAFECAVELPGPPALSLATLRRIAAQNYTALCLQWSGRLAEHAFAVANPVPLLSCLLESAITHIQETVCAMADHFDASQVLFEIGTIGSLLRRAERLAVTVQCGTETDRLLTHLERALHEALDTPSPSSERLVLTLTLLRQIARTSSFWTPLVRVKLPSLFSLLVRIIDQVTQDELLLDEVLGSIDLLLTLAPADIAARSLIASALVAGSDDHDAIGDDNQRIIPFPASIQSRINIRMPFPSPEAMEESLLFGSSVASVLSRGRYSLQPHRVWDHLDFVGHPNVHGDAGVTPGLDNKRPGGHDASGLSPRTAAKTGPLFTSLSNNGSLSLADFDAQRTKDLIIVPALSARTFGHGGATPNVALVVGQDRPFTERSYGDGVGGEPRMASDLQTGATNLPHAHRSRSFKVPAFPIAVAGAFVETQAFSTDESDDESVLSGDTTARGESSAHSIRSSADQIGTGMRKRKRSEDDLQNDDGDDASSSSELSDVPTATDVQITSSPAASAFEASARSGTSTARRGRSLRGRRK